MLIGVHATIFIIMVTWFIQVARIEPLCQPWKQHLCRRIAGAIVIRNVYILTWTARNCRWCLTWARRALEEPSLGRRRRPVRWSWAAIRRGWRSCTAQPNKTSPEEWARDIIEAIVNLTTYSGRRLIAFTCFKIQTWNSVSWSSAQWDDS